MDLSRFDKQIVFTFTGFYLYFVCMCVFFANNLFVPPDCYKLVVLLLKTIFSKQVPQEHF